MNKYIVRNKFYVNLARKDEVFFPQVRVSKSFYESHIVKEESALPIPVAKLIHKGASCYVQIRSADNFYIAYFKNFITYWGEFSVFEDESEAHGIPLIFLSETYRKRLKINDISEKVFNEHDLRKNIKEITIKLPKNIAFYLLYLFRACSGHLELYSFLMLILASFGIVSSIVSFAVSFELNRIFISGSAITLISSIIPFNWLKFKYLYKIFLAGIFIIIVGYIIKTRACSLDTIRYILFT